MALRGSKQTVALSRQAWTGSCGANPRGRRQDASFQEKMRTLRPRRRDGPPLKWSDVRDEPAVFGNPVLMSRSSIEKVSSFARFGQTACVDFAKEAIAV